MKSFILHSHKKQLLLHINTKVAKGYTIIYIHSK